MGGHPASTLAPVRLDSADLLRLIRGIADNQRLWRPRVRFGARDRWWTRLYADTNVEFWLITWLTDTGTDLHDHGESAAAFVVAEGSVEEVRPGSAPGTCDVVRLRAGSGRRVEPGVIHDVRNPGPEPAISLHAYSPPLSAMQYYDQRGSGLVPR